MKGQSVQTQAKTRNRCTQNQNRALCKVNTKPRGKDIYRSNFYYYFILTEDAPLPALLSRPASPGLTQPRRPRPAASTQRGQPKAEPAGREQRRTCAAHGPQPGERGRAPARKRRETPRAAAPSPTLPEEPSPRRTAWGRAAPASPRLPSDPGAAAGPRPTTTPGSRFLKRRRLSEGGPGPVTAHHHPAPARRKFLSPAHTAPSPYDGGSGSHAAQRRRENEPHRPIRGGERRDPAVHPRDSAGGAPPGGRAQPRACRPGPAAPRSPGTRRCLRLLPARGGPHLFRLLGSRSQAAARGRRLAGLLAAGSDARCGPDLLSAPRRSCRARKHPGIPEDGGGAAAGLRLAPPPPCRPWPWGARRRLGGAGCGFRRAPHGRPGGSAPPALVRCGSGRLSGNGLAKLGALGPQWAAALKARRSPGEAAQQNSISRRAGLSNQGAGSAISQQHQPEASAQAALAHNGKSTNYTARFLKEGYTAL